MCSVVAKVYSALEGISVLDAHTEINDIVRVCALPKLAEWTPLSICLSFNLGDFYVTVTSYKNENLKNKEGNNPVHIDPVQNHYRNFV